MRPVALANVILLASVTGVESPPAKPSGILSDPEGNAATDDSAVAAAVSTEGCEENAKDSEKEDEDDEYTTEEEEEMETMFTKRVTLSCIIDGQPKVGPLQKVSANCYVVNSLLVHSPCTILMEEAFAFVMSSWIFMYAVP